MKTYNIKQVRQEFRTCNYDYGEICADNMEQALEKVCVELGDDYIYDNYNICYNKYGNEFVVYEKQERYYVAIDLQCGEFGMYRNYTLSQWRKQAIEWCYMDDNDELAEYIYNIKDSELLTYIGEMWTLVFRKCRKDKKNFSRNDLTDFEDETLDEFVRLRFTFLGE